MSEGLVEQVGRVLRPLSVAGLEQVLVALGCESGDLSQGERVDRIAVLERLKGAVAAAQARETVAFKASRVEAERAAGVTVRRRGVGIGIEVALARRESPNKGSRLVGLAEALVREMPCTMAALTAGVLSEWRATLMVRETACLSVQDRRVVDARMADQVATLSDAGLVAQARRHAYQLDPVGFLQRARRAETDRHVSGRAAPETMCRISALLPATQGVAVIAALTRQADRLRAAGDPRTKGQLMADILVERVTGQTRADQTPVEVQLKVTDTTLFAGGSEPGWLAGYGPVPAPYARTLIRNLDPDTKTWIRRFFTDPCTGLLTAVDARRRLVTGILRTALVFRDVSCRTPWCGAPIRHSDHVIAVEDGGHTTEANTQGLCEACNYTKQAPGWTSTPGPDGAGKSVQITTPTGHTYTSRPPPLPGDEPPPDIHAPPDEVPEEVADPEPRYLEVIQVRWADVLKRSA